MPTPRSSRAAARVGAAARRRTRRDRGRAQPGGPGARRALRGLEQAAPTGRGGVLVGHTADDQAETVLLQPAARLRDGRARGMAPRQGTIVRPLLGAAAGATRSRSARGCGSAPVADPMNGETRFRRVWLRREVLPLLEAGAHRDLATSSLARPRCCATSRICSTRSRRALAAAGDPPRWRRSPRSSPRSRRRALRSWLGGTAAVAGRDRRAPRRRRGRAAGGRAARWAPRRRRGGLSCSSRGSERVGAGRRRRPWSSRCPGAVASAASRSRPGSSTRRRWLARRSRDLRRRRRLGRRSCVAAARGARRALRAARPAGYEVVTASPSRVARSRPRPIVAASRWRRLGRGVPYRRSGTRHLAAPVASSG